MKYDIEFIKVNDLHPYEKNAKKHPQEQIDYIKNSIKQFGFRQNLVVDKDNVVIIGHGRLEAAKQLGLEYVPCVKAEDLTEEQIKALRLADNKVAESEWDFDLLDSELDDIFDIDMSDFGFDDVLEDDSHIQKIKESEEVDLSEYDDENFECECPRCGFKFNRS
jgi:ParB-like chromosome segregation protein Spo0J